MYSWLERCLGRKVDVISEIVVGHFRAAERTWCVRFYPLWGEDLAQLMLSDKDQMMHLMPMIVSGLISRTKSKQDSRGQKNNSKMSLIVNVIMKAVITD